MGGRARSPNAPSRPALLSGDRSAEKGGGARLAPGIAPDLAAVRARPGEMDVPPAPPLAEAVPQPRFARRGAAEAAERLAASKAETARMLQTLREHLDLAPGAPGTAPDGAGASAGAGVAAGALGGPSPALGGLREAARPAAGGPRRITTYMVRNIPSSCTPEDLMQDWPTDGSYDFLYLPMSSGGKQNLGYVFINLVSEEKAVAFRERWHMRRLPHVQRSRRMNVAVADLQGLEENVLRLRGQPSGRLRSRHCRPLIIKDGAIVRLEDF